MAVTHLNDRFLVEAHKGGDPEAFRAIVEAHRPALHSHALRRLSDPAAAEDAVQETLLRAYRSLPRFNGEYRLGAWLHRILTNVCIDEAIRRQREAELVDRCAAQPAPLAPGAEQTLALDLPREEMKAALQSLPDSHREALLLRFVDDLPYAQVADLEGVTEANARARVSRARAALRSVLRGAVAAFVFVVPFGRRQERALAANPDAATSAAGTGAVPVVPDAVATVSSVGSVSSVSVQVSSHLTPLAGAAAQVGDVAASGGMAVMSKVAVAVSVVAAVAVPTGAVMSNRAPATPPAAEAVAPAAGDTVGGTSDEPGTAIVLSSGPSSTGDDGESDGLDLASSGSSEPGVPTGGAKAPRSAAGGATSPTSAPDPSGEAPGEGEPTTDARGGVFEGDPVTIREAGPRLEIDGQVVLDNGAERVVGSLAGKLLVDDADPKAPDAPRRLDGVLTFTSDDGRTAEIRLVGTVVVDDTESGGRSYELTGDVLVEGDDVGLGDDGPFDASLIRRSDGGGSLLLVVNGGPPPDDDEDEGSAEASSTSSTSTTEAGTAS